MRRDSSHALRFASSFPNTFNYNCTAVPSARDRSCTYFAGLFLGVFFCRCPCSRWRKREEKKSETVSCHQTGCGVFVCDSRQLYLTDHTPCWRLLCALSRYHDRHQIIPDKTRSTISNFQKKKKKLARGCPALWSHTPHIRHFQHTPRTHTPEKGQ